MYVGVGCRGVIALLSVLNWLWLWLWLCLTGKSEFPELNNSTMHMKVGRFDKLRAVIFFS